MERLCGLPIGKISYRLPRDGFDFPQPSVCTYFRFQRSETFRYLNLEESFDAVQRVVINEPAARVLHFLFPNTSSPALLRFVAFRPLDYHAPVRRTLHKQLAPGLVLPVSLTPVRDAHGGPGDHVIRVQSDVFPTGLCRCLHICRNFSHLISTISRGTQLDERFVCMR